MVAGIPLGLGPAQPMTISLLKDQGQMTNVHTGMLSISCTVGSGTGPFLMGEVLQAHCSNWESLQTLHLYFHLNAAAFT